MIGYEELKRIKQETKVFVLTAPDKHERLLFYKDYMSSRHTPIIARQIPVNNRWRYTEGLLSNELALRTGGICTTAERGNHKFREFVDKGYVKTVTNMEDLSMEV